MPKLKVIVENKQSEMKIPVGLRMLVRRCCQAVLATEGFTHDAEVSVSFINNKEIQQLNRIYRNKDASTDVLSFPLLNEGKVQEGDVNENGIVMLGDVVISMETAAAQARMYGHTLDREVGFLTVHSMLHLLGYDHETSSLEERIMREKEESILEKLGISRDLTFIQETEQ